VIVRKPGGRVKRIPTTGKKPYKRQRPECWSRGKEGSENNGVIKPKRGKKKKVESWG